MFTASFQSPRNFLQPAMYLLLMTSMYPGTGLAHGKKAHTKPAAADTSASQSEPDAETSGTDEPGKQEDAEGMVSGTVKLEPAVKAAMESIAHNYLLDIKSIFKQSCFNCHTSMTEYPWYYSLPGVKQLIDQDVEEAREHLDFSNDYPFISHGELTDDLKSIGKAVSNASMPPMSYNLMHWSNKVTDEQKQKVLQWVDHSLALLTNAGYVASAD